MRTLTEASSTITLAVNYVVEFEEELDDTQAYILLQAFRKMNGVLDSYAKRKIAEHIANGGQVIGTVTQEHIDKQAAIDMLSGKRPIQMPKKPNADDIK